ncbi:hypothetical protein [Pseudarthrobacter chlorophenolicus]|uniref:hypothetical protein n=1 Tax=Pseudarthrobacter chlorophenolicus TaxID=85085 RepID=UPI0005F2F0E1|nr:hypothetical protein [Pseudarthrobacter chlorophenolicus]
MPAHRTPFHLVRASALATGILTLAAGAHVAGGGQLPAPGILLAILALTGLASTAATRLKLSFPAMAGLMGGGQLALHELFATFSVSSLPSGPVAAHAGHQHGVPSLPPDLLALAGHVDPADPASGSLMLAAHALATLGCALLLAKGEAALWALAGWLRPLAGLPAPLVFNDAGPVPAALPPTAAPLRPWRNLRQDSRRGPPSAVALSY